MSFASVVNCCDGRVQIPVINYLLDRFEVSYVDVVTKNGVDGLLARQEDLTAVSCILESLGDSVRRHGSQGIAVVGHYDCAGNQVNRATHYEHIRAAVEFLSRSFPQHEVVGLWLASQWQVEEICHAAAQPDDETEKMTAEAE